MTDLAIALLLFLIPVFLIYVVHPITQKNVPLHRVRQQFQAFNPGDLAPSVAPFFYNNVQAITGLGFEVIDYLTRTDPTGVSTSCLIYMVNRKTLERAEVVGVYATINGEARLSSHYFEFTTKFTDDSSISTNDLFSAGAFKTVAKYRSARLSWIHDPSALYDIHQFHVEKYAEGRQKMLPPPGQEVEAYEKATDEVWNVQVQSGLATFDPSTQTYYRSWYGAFYIVWCLLWPMKQIRLAQRKGYAMKLLKEYEADRGRTASLA